MSPGELRSSWKAPCVGEGEWSRVGMKELQADEFRLVSLRGAGVTHEDESVLAFKVSGSL